MAGNDTPSKRGDVWRPRIVSGADVARPQTDFDVSTMYPEVWSSENTSHVFYKTINDAPRDTPENVSKAFRAAAFCFDRLNHSLSSLLRRTQLLDRIARFERTLRLNAQSELKKIKALLNLAKKEILYRDSVIENQQKQMRELEDKILSLKDESDRLKANAIIDSLTNAHNRAYLETRLTQMHAGAAAGRKPYAILFMDLDGFKYVNDTFGEEIGDEKLKSAARILKSCVRGSDTVCRIGGDEFVVLLEDISPKDALDKVRQILRESSHSHDTPVFSIGVFFCDNDTAMQLSPREALLYANLAEMGAKGRIANARVDDIGLSWDNTLPGERQRAAPAGKYGHAAIALLQPTRKELFITGIPNTLDSSAPKMSSMLLTFMHSEPRRADHSALVAKRHHLT